MFQDDKFHEDHEQDFVEAEKLARASHPSGDENQLALICYRRPLRGKSVDEWEVVPVPEYKGMIIGIKIYGVEDEVQLVPQLDDEYNPIYLNLSFNADEPTEDLVRSSELDDKVVTTYRPCKLYGPKKPWGEIIDFANWFPDGPGSTFEIKKS